MNKAGKSVKIALVKAPAAKPAAKAAKPIPLKLIFYSCGVATWVKCLIFQESRIGFRKNVVPRHDALLLELMAIHAIMC